MITVVDVEAARRALTAGELSCPRPDCAGILRVWSRARPRRVRRPDGATVTLIPDRALCRACRGTNVLLPLWCLPRRGYDVQVVGAALLAAAEGAGYRRVAATVAVPPSTVRGWLDAVRAGSAQLIATVTGVIKAAGSDLRPPLDAPAWAGRPLPEAVAALGVAARAFALTLATPPLPRPTPVQGSGQGTGIDYLRIIAERHRVSIHSGFGVIDPTGILPHLRGWLLINVLTYGRLLTSPGPAG